jgi:peptidoglycan/LPS O-acetylase OafA/YrhL
LRGDAVAAFGYVTNWYLVFGQESYFETVGRPSLQQHLWSLVIQEQFSSISSRFGKLYPYCHREAFSCRVQLD